MDEETGATAQDNPLKAAMGSDTAKLLQLLLQGGRIDSLVGGGGVQGAAMLRKEVAPISLKADAFPKIKDFLGDLHHIHHGDGRDFLSFSKAFLDDLGMTRIHEVVDRVRRRLAGTSMDEAEFLCGMLERVGCATTVGMGQIMFDAMAKEVDEIRQAGEA
jgi:hypothetical protein